MARDLYHPESGLNLASLIKTNLSYLQNNSYKLPDNDNDNDSKSNLNDKVVSEETIFSLIKESL
jgi:hypothetical protein